MVALRTSLCLLTYCLTTCAADAKVVCSPISGANQIWARASLHWILVGELHGSNEGPAAFGDLVCNALAQGKRIIVALERPSSEQRAINDILTAKNLSSARQALLPEPGWENGMDGRASLAMLRLLIFLRYLHTSYPKLRVAAFDVPYSGVAPGARDEAMGRALLSLRMESPNSVVLILVGNAHAMKAPQFGFNPAAMYLPQEEILSLEITDRHGESWSSIDDSCGPMKGGVGDKGKTKPRGIFLDPSLAPFGKVDGILSLGVPLTPSAPASGEPSPLPACRIKYLAAHPAEHSR
jgi:hypothetical protein